MNPTETTEATQEAGIVDAARAIQSLLRKQGIAARVCLNYSNVGHLDSYAWDKRDFDFTWFPNQLTFDITKGPTEEAEEDIRYVLSDIIILNAKGQKKFRCVLECIDPETLGMGTQTQFEKPKYAYDRSDPVDGSRYVNILRTLWKAGLVDDNGEFGEDLEDKCAEEE
jgi:hypothetical protein